jgi:hypothetical protein
MEDKENKLRNKNGTYYSTIQGSKKWIAEHREIHYDRVKKYYRKNSETIKAKAKVRYQFNKAYAELAGIEIQ